MSVYAPSRKRQTLLTTDAAIVHRLYAAACVRFGAAAVEKNVALIWTLRCMWGMTEELPFHATQSQSLKELLWVARAVCGYGAMPPIPQRSPLKGDTP